jgi:hypothetical protein
MVDAVAVWPPGHRFKTAAGDIVAGGSVEFYDAGTTTPKTVHSDAALTTALGSVVYMDAGGALVSQQGGSTKVTVYVGTAPYKVVIKDSGGVTLETKDNLAGAFDSASILETLVLIPETAVETLTADTVLDAADAGGLKNCNTTGGAFTVTLPDATAVNNGYRVGVRMAGSANQAKIKSTGSQTIARAGVTATALALTQLGETVWLVADGGNWLVDTYVPPLMGAVGVIAIADRLSSPPGSPTPGARYIVTSGPTGDWSSFAQHDIAEANGQGGWFRYTPATDCGWIAYVQDEELYYFFRASAWVIETASDTQVGTVRYASVAEMETGTATDRVVVPGRQHRHPAHPKAWGVVTVSGGTPTLAASYNIFSITDTAVGRLTVTIDVDFSSTNYAIIGTALGSSGSDLRAVTVSQGSQAVGSFELSCNTAGGSLSDPTAWFFALFGDQA